MSFGWSAGDILAAIKFIVEVANALDATDGAAKEFREASTFLRDIKSALTPLQTFTALDTRPNYKADIERQVEAIKVPIEKFVEEVRGLQNDLGVVKEGRLRHLKNIPSKLKWHFYVSKRSLALQKEVGQHLKVIDALMRQLTIDMIDVLQSNLKGDVEKSLEDRLNVHLPVLQTKLLAELSERDISAQATWQVQLENLLESYLGPQRVTLPSYTAEEERRPTQVTSNSILYRGSILRVNVSHLQARRSDSILEQYSHQMTGITTDTNVIWKIQNWWCSEKAEFVCVQCEPSQPLERSIGSDIAALGRAANVNVIAHSCQRINSGGMAHSPTEEFINLVYGMIYEICNNWQEDFSTFRDLSKARFMLLDYTPDSIPSALELLCNLLSLMGGRCLIVIERMDIFDNSNDSALEMHLKSLFALLRSKEGIACLKTFITTESYSRMIVDEVREENYVDASLDNDSAGFLSLTEFEAGINVKGSE